MRLKTTNLVTCALLAAAIVSLPLAGCSSSTFGGTGANGKQAQIADISDKGNLTADTALTEARNHFRNNNFGYSAAYYKKVAELQPQNPEAYVGLGASYDRLGRFDLSDRVYASLLKLTGATAQYYNNVGYSNMLRGNLASAYTNFRKASQLEPENTVIANNLQLLADAASATRA